MKTVVLICIAGLFAVFSSVPAHAGAETISPGQLNSHLGRTEAVDRLVSDSVTEARTVYAGDGTLSRFAGKIRSRGASSPEYAATDFLKLYYPAFLDTDAGTYDGISVSAMPSRGLTRVTFKFTRNDTDDYFQIDVYVDRSLDIAEVKACPARFCKSR